MTRRSAIAAIVGMGLAAWPAFAQAPPPAPPGPPPGAMVAPTAPPPPPAEAVPPPPPGPPGVMVWQPGYWRWDGRAYAWVPGVYVHRPRRRAVWIAPRWVPGPYGWVWQPGHWR